MSSAAAAQQPQQQQQQRMATGQQQQQQQQQQHHASSQPQIDPDVKKAKDILDALNSIENVRQDISTILENVGKANSSNNYAGILAPKVEQNLSQNTKSSSETDSSNNNKNNSKQDRFLSMKSRDQKFFESTDTKYLQDRILDLNKNLSELDKVIKELQPVSFINTTDFNSILLNQIDERSNLTGNKLINNYRWSAKIQENISCTTLMPYKRFQHTYMEKKSAKYQSYSIKPNKKEEIEKFASQNLYHNEIKVVSSQKTENLFVLDILMPQNFKFTILLFDLSVEKIQVRQLDTRILKLYASSKPSDEICHVDSEHKHFSNVFQRLEENCVQALLYFRTEQGNNHFKCLLIWLKNFTNLFNAKCVRCEKHLLNGVPPTFRDLKTFEAYHDECRV